MYFALTAGGSSQRWLTSTGEPTAGVYGFARELLRILEQEKPDYLAVAFDTGNPVGHGACVEGETWKFYRVAKSRIAHVHIKDAKPGPDRAITAIGAKTGRG